MTRSSPPGPTAWSSARRQQCRSDAPGRGAGSDPRRRAKPVSVGVLERPITGSAPEPTTGGVPARRAMLRWAWRLFRREWRQQLLILLLIIVAVAAVVVGLGCCHQHPPASQRRVRHRRRPRHVQRGKASPIFHLAQRRRFAALVHRYGAVQVIDNETFNVPGSDQTYQLRSQDPNGPYGGRCSSCSPGLTRPGRTRSPSPPGLASELNLRVGDTWPKGGKDRRRRRAESPEPARRVRACPRGR
jgi:hypothetical protein